MQLGLGRKEAADTVEIRFKEGEGDQRRKGAVAVRTKTPGGSGKGRKGT